LDDEEVIWHVTQKSLNNWIENDHAAHKRLPRYMCGIRDLCAVRATSKGSESVRAIREVQLDVAIWSVAREITLTENIIKVAA
jgi:transposase-like protein